MAIEYHEGMLFRLFTVVTSLAVLLPATMLAWFTYQSDEWSDIASMYRKSAEQHVVEYEKGGVSRDFSMSMFKISKEHMDNALKKTSEYENKKSTTFAFLVFGPASLVIGYYLLVFIATGRRPPLPTLRMSPR